MTFLNPFVLFGLVAAAIPLLLHLLNIRKLRTIDFSTLAFLKELQKSRMRKVKIRQWLLLILRTLIILFLVFAFSRPALKGTLAGLGTHAKTTIVIILDDTYSMSLRDDRGVYLKQAQTCALGLVDLLAEGDDALLIRLSDLPAATIGEPTHDTRMLREAINQTAATYKRRTVEEALTVTGQLLRRSNNFNKEIYILTDNQKTSVESGRREENTQQAGRLYDPNVRVFFVPLSDQPFENVGIAGVEVAPTLFQRGKPFALQATVRNYGSAPMQNHLVNLYLNGVRVMQKSVTLDGHAQKTVEFTATPERAGILRGRVELEDDEFAEDNTRFFSVTVPEKVNVLLSSSDPRSSSYIRLALSVHNQDDATTLIRLTELLPQQLTYSAMVQADVVLLSNVASLTPAQAEQLAQFSSQGGGIVIFPGDAMQVGAYNSSLMPALQLPPLLPTDKQKLSSSFISFEKVDYDHPIFHGMFESGSGPKMEKREVESPRVSFALRFTSQKEIRSIISLTDGTPFLWERASGILRNEANPHGVLGFAVAANTSWSDFPMKGIFIPLLYQTILYAASGGSTLVASPSSLVGERVDVSLSKAGRTLNPASGSPTALRVLDPAGEETLVQPNSPREGGRSMSASVSFGNTSEPGIYTVVRARDTVAAVPVNVDPAESIAELCPPAEFVTMAGKHGIEKNQIVFVKSPESISTVVLQSRFGVELWKYFLLGALIFALMEMALGRESKDEGV